MSDNLVNCNKCKRIKSNFHELRKLYNCPIGHSDHTYGVEIPPLAIAAGACIIEKHFSKL